jgi:hypothetical protein
MGHSVPASQVLAIKQRGEPDRDTIRSRLAGGGIEEPFARGCLNDAVSKIYRATDHIFDETTNAPLGFGGDKPTNQAKYGCSQAHFAEHDFSP